MLALYLLTQLPYTHWVLFLKANLEHIWHIADPLSLRISIICLRHEQGVIKIHNCIDHLPFLSLSSLEHSSLVPRLLFVFFPVVFPLSLYVDTRTILSVTALTSFQKWNMTCSSNCMCNKKESSALMTLLLLQGGTKLVDGFDGYRGDGTWQWQLSQIITGDCW